MEQSAQNDSGSVQTVEQTIATPTLTPDIAGPAKPAPTVQSPFHAPPKEDAGWIRWIVFLIIFIAVAMGAAYLEYQTKYNRPAPVETAPVVIQKLPTPTPDGVQEWKTYENTKLGFSLNYPSDFVIEEMLDSGAVNRIVIKSNDTADIQIIDQKLGGDQKPLRTEEIVVDNKNVSLLYYPMIEGSEDVKDVIAYLENTGKTYTIAFSELTDPNTAVTPEEIGLFKEILGSFTFQTATPSTAPDTQVVCTQKAKQCADGSYVSRIGPNCEFAACPGQ